MHVFGNEVIFRMADRADRDALLAMQAMSLRKLAAGVCTADQIESFLRCPGTMDDALLDEGTSVVAQTAGHLIGVAVGVSGRPAMSAQARIQPRSNQ